MGGCATKPKVSKADAGELPVQPPAEEVVVVAAKEEKKVADGELVIEEKVKEIVENDDTKVDDEPGSNKRRSLSLLFKQNPEEKSVATEKISTAAVLEAEPTKEPEKSKPEEVAEILKTNEPAETKFEEKSITSLEQLPVTSAVENVEEVKSVDDNPSVSTKEPPAVIVTEDSVVADKENTIEEAKPAPEPTASVSKPDDKAKQTEPEKENPYEKTKDQGEKEE